MSSSAGSSAARWSSLAVLVIAALVVGAGGLSLALRPADTGAVADAPQPDPLAAEPVVAPLPYPARVRWIAVGGGSQPDMNQVSLEEDLLAAREALGEGGVMLFAGGPGTRSVQVLDPEERGDSLRVALGEIFSPRAGRDARYRAARLPMHGAATLDTLYDAFTSALSQGSDPLLVYVAAHGDIGSAPNESSILLWGGGALDVMTLAQTLDETPSERRVRFVITSCYAGGFAELAFRDADPSAGVTDQDRCGVFATAWDTEASGCDPNPERAAHESWAAHFLPALAGRDRTGTERRAEIDLDADTQIGVLEAYAFARAHSTSFDLPTTTSNRLLRHLVAEGDPHATPLSLPEEELVLRVIGARLGLSDEADARARVDAFQTRLAELEAAIEERAAQSDDAWFALGGAMLSRWPVLDDPYHPDFDATLSAERDAIGAFLEDSLEYGGWLEAQDDLDALSQSHAAIEVAQAPLRRWLEAHETMRLAGQLAAAGGEGFSRWQRMRACEMASP